MGLQSTQKGIETDGSRWNLPQAVTETSQLYKFIFQTETVARLCSSPARWPHHMPFWFPLLISNFFFSGISSPGNKTVSRGSWSLWAQWICSTEQRQQMVILHWCDSSNYRDTQGNVPKVPTFGSPHRESCVNWTAWVILEVLLHVPEENTTLAAGVLPAITNPGGRGRGDGCGCGMAHVFVQANLQAGRFERFVHECVFSITCESILFPQSQYFPQPCSLPSLLAWISCKNRVSFCTTPLDKAAILWFTVLLLKGQRGPCGITEKGNCKKKFLRKQGAQLQWIRGNFVNWQSSMDSQSREEIRHFSLKKQRI